MDVLMSEDKTRRKARKGTTSCTECRRRKVRCIRSSEDAPSCRRCEERGSECMIQKYASQPFRPPRLPSRYRISQLESQVASLSKVVCDIESKLRYQATQTPKSTPMHVGSSPGSDESDDDSSNSDVLTTNAPSHIRSLFQNDWLSVDTHPQGEELQDHKGKGCSQLLDTARHALQELIPSRDEVSSIASSASRWLILLHAVLPQPFAARSQEELLACYEEMRKPNVDPMILASWLLTIAITAQEIEQEHDSPAFQPKGTQRFSSFHRAVSEAVESTILCHDRLMSTVQGLGMAMHFFRLQMSQGNFQKAWLRLRHFIAIAELMGLPKAYQTNKINGSHDDEILCPRAQLWDAFSCADSLIGMVVNLPPGITYRQIETRPLCVDGIVQPRVYLSKLTNITSKIQYDANMPNVSNTELYASILDLDRQLQMLASQPLKSWWFESSQEVKPYHVVQFLHVCVKMRIHLSFAMRQNLDEEYIYSRLACTDACESVVERYLFLRRSLPPGIFVCPILDLQAFTATIVLLLTSHNLPSTDHSKLQINKSKIDSLVVQIIELMSEKSKGISSSKFAQLGVITIGSLKKLLQQDGEASNVQELKLKIPLLGKVHIRRNSHTSRGPNYSTLPPSSQMPSNSGLSMTNEQQTSQRQQLTVSNEAHENFAFQNQSQEQWPWDPLSWSIENNYDDYFQDTLMAENMDQFSMWQNYDSGF